MHKVPHLVFYYENNLSLIDFSKENSTNDPDDSTDTIRRYQGSKKPFEERKSRSSSFISSFDDEQKPLFLGTVDSTPRKVKSTRLHGEETVPPSGRIHVDKRSHSCKGNWASALSSSLDGKLAFQNRRTARVQVLLTWDRKLTCKPPLPKDRVTSWDSGNCSSWKITTKSQGKEWWSMGFAHPKILAWEVFIAN